MMIVNPEGFALVAFLGLVNWIATEVIVTSVIFKDVREVMDRLGKRVSQRSPRLGEKICYFLKCALCVGVWVGFIQAAFFSGPLQLEGWWSWATFIANGLLFKGAGHLFLQVNGWFHNRIELMKSQVQAIKSEEERRSSEHTFRGFGALDGATTELPGVVPSNM